MGLLVVEQAQKGKENWKERLDLELASLLLLIATLVVGVIVAVHLGVSHWSLVHQLAQQLASC